MERIVVACLVLAGCGSSSGGPGDDDGGPPLTQAEATTACVIYGGCLGDGINDCYTDAMPFWSPAEARCVIAAGADCSAVRACFGLTTPVFDPACTGSTYSCDGANLVVCSGGARATVTCGAASPAIGFGVGPTCVPSTTGGALCGVSTCTTESATCDGTVASGCNASKGVLMTIDCARYGQSCASGVCTSTGGGAACTSGTLPRCDGTSIARCRSGIDAYTDCTSLATGASCFLGGAASEPYCGYASACYPTKGAETCNGTAVTFCAAGVVATVDCTSLGFTSCFSGHCARL